MFRIHARTTVSVVDAELAGNSAVAQAVARFKRDMAFVLLPSAEENTDIRIFYHSKLECDEAWTINASDKEMTILAGGPLGVVYALIQISYVALGIQPLWFWNDQSFTKKKNAEFPIGSFSSEKVAYRFRGWFLNDEVLLSTWMPSDDSRLPWEMAFESLLRLGGNLVIPGTDRHSRQHVELASSMGLWIAQHHAEPLGAEMFSRAYPHLQASYVQHADLFEKLWHEAVMKQRNFRMVWTIGFRGQGDIPFWDNDPEFDTDEKRGKLLSQILEKQALLIREYDTEAVMACNLYGESVDLYNKGIVKLPGDVIRVWGDNGYGRMVSRRQGLDNPRHPAVPGEKEKEAMHGMYYHVSFYDLQAANHITMTPVSLGMMKSELENAFIRNIDDLLILNVSNVRPHTMPASFVAEFWRTGHVDVEMFLRDYCKAYFPEAFASVSRAFLRYAEASLPYGREEDERAADQFYTYSLRAVLGQWLTGDTKSSISSLGWLLSAPFSRQVARLGTMAANATRSYGRLLTQYSKVSLELKQSRFLFDATLGMYARLYESLAKTLLLFSEAAKLFNAGRYLDAFIRCGDAVVQNEIAVSILRGWEQGKWMGYYENDCLTDISQNTYLLTVLMEHIRSYGDAPGYYTWQRLLTYSDEDRNVVLITNWEKHMSGWELYQLYQKRLSSNSRPKDD